jgi:glutamine synthetase
VACDDTVQSLERFALMVTEARTALHGLESATAHHDADPMKHAQQIKAVVRPAMMKLRVAVDELETNVAADLWPPPTYRELLFLQ